MNFFIRILLSSVAIIISTYLLPGITLLGDGIEPFTTSFIVAVIISLLNATIRPLIIILTIPITVVTLGLFLVVINAIIILIADAIVQNFVIDGFGWALIFSLLMWLINSLLTDLKRKD